MLLRFRSSASRVLSGLRTKIEHWRTEACWNWYPPDSLSCGLIDRISLVGRDDV